MYCPLLIELTRHQELFNYADIIEQTITKHTELPEKISSTDRMKLLCTDAKSLLEQYDTPGE